MAVLVWNAAIYLDSSAQTVGTVTVGTVTAGTVAAAEPGWRGATMGLHSMCGYAGGFAGPLAVGIALDIASHDWRWVLAFGHVAPVTLAGLWLLRRLTVPRATISAR